MHRTIRKNANWSAASNGSSTRRDVKGFLYLLLYLTPTFKINQTLDLFGVELAICAAQPTSAVGMVLSQILHRRLNLQFVLALRTLLLLVNLETRTEKKKLRVTKWNSLICKIYKVTHLSPLSVIRERFGSFYFRRDISWRFRQSN